MNNLLQNTTLRKNVTILSVVFLVLALLVGLFLITRQQDTRERAQEPVCRETTTITCTVVPIDGAQNVGNYVYDVSVIDTLTNQPITGAQISGSAGEAVQVTASNGSAATGVRFNFNVAGLPGASYKCKITARSQSGKFCDGDVTRESETRKCEPTPTSTDAPSPSISTTPEVPPPGGPGDECACGSDGSVLDCSNRAESYKGDDGPGLIIINPVFKQGVPACFVCEELVVRDEKTGRLLPERYDCTGKQTNYDHPDPVPTGIRLHQADGKLCRDYTIEVIGKSTKPDATPIPQKCGDCDGKVCCPKCQEVKILEGCGEFTDYDGKKFTCNFTINPSCPIAGPPFIVTVENYETGRPYTIDFDDLNDPGKKPIKGSISHSYEDTGVYDLTLECDYYAGTAAGVKVCKKRISVGCSSPPPPSPSPTVTGTPFCPKLDFKAICL